jgi:hypothetical protein
MTRAPLCQFAIIPLACPFLESSRPLRFISGSYRVIFDALEREAIGGGLGPSNAQGVLDHGPRVFSYSILPPTFEVTGASEGAGRLHVELCHI